MRIVAADLDRTVIPNGPAEDDDSVDQLTHVLAKNELELIYVTARRVESVESAIKRYGLPQPRAIIGQVGTTIHLWNDGTFVPHYEWNHEIKTRSSGWNRTGIAAQLSSISNLVIQKESEQNEFKLSYTLDSSVNWSIITNKVISIVEEYSHGDAAVTASEDLNSGEAYIDIMPSFVSKYSALEFYRNYCGFAKSSFICAGDSENDLSMLLSEYSSIVVNNASDDLKKSVLKDKNGSEAIVASGRFGNSGNYGSGIVEGLTVHGWVESPF